MSVVEGEKKSKQNFYKINNDKLFYSKRTNFKINITTYRSCIHSNSNQLQYNY